MVFDKAKRELAKKSIDPVLWPISLDYIVLLEEVARKAIDLRNLINPDGLSSQTEQLENALDKVDWMRE